MPRPCSRSFKAAQIFGVSGYDEAFQQIDAKYNLPKSDISALIRMVKNSEGKLSDNRRKQYAHLPAEVLDDIETVIQGVFALPPPVPRTYNLFVPFFP